ncbi:amidase [Niveomyces insectorum RCEF 264]|uniref:Amidase n=1 Tax=Niveomyces insectorum RCEF 264 TaxID=1081102 RepID=A0A167S306_9HYPO|nr:amidase [Niveomyces insectorum RCEF 264]
MQGRRRDRDSIARLEAANDADAHLGDDAAPPNKHALQAIGRCMRHDCSLSVRGSRSLIYRDVLLRASAPPNPFALHKESPPAVRTAHARTGLADIPAAVAEILLNVYIEKIVAADAIFREPELRDLYDRVYHYPGEQQPPLNDQETYKLLMVFAISTMCSKADDFRQPASLAESFCAEAADYFDVTDSSPGSLQCLLITMQLAYFLPHIGNLEKLADEAMRMATELCLHTEAHASQGDQEGRESKKLRRLFWQTYNMERSVNGVLRKQPAIDDDHVNVAFLKTGDAHESQSSSLNYRAITRYRHFQSEVNTRQHLLGDDTAVPYDAWIAQKEIEVASWRGRELHSRGDAASPEWFNFGVAYMQLSLHRPCLANPAPSIASVGACITAAGRIVDGYVVAAERSVLKFVWHAVNTCFEAGAILLYNLAMNRPLLQTCSTDLIQQTEDVLGPMDKLLSVLCERWPMARITVEAFRVLCEHVLHPLLPTGAEQGDEIGNLMGKVLHDTVFRNRPGEVDLGNNVGNALLLQVPATATPPFLDDLFADNDNNGIGWLGTLSNLDMFDDFGLFDVTTAPSFSLDQDFVYTGPPVLGTPVATPSEPTESGREADAASPNEDADVEEMVVMVREAFGHLPSCVRCRRRKIKCDLKFPSCGYCVRRGRDCTIFDQTLNEEVSRAHLHRLKTRFEELSTAALDEQSQREVGFHRNRRRHHGRLSAAPGQGAVILQTGGTRSDGSMRELCMGHTSTLFSLQASAENLAGHAEEGVDARPLSSPSIGFLFSDVNENISVNLNQVLTLENAEALHDVYYNGIGALMPSILEPKQAPGWHLSSATGTMGPEYNLMLAVAARALGKKDAWMTAIATALVQRAIHGDSQFFLDLQQQGVAGLTLVTLLCVYFLLDPTAGNVWRLLGYASRLCAEMNSDSALAPSSENIHWPLWCTVYKLECDVSIAYGRPGRPPSFTVNVLIKHRIQRHLLRAHGPPNRFDVLHEQLRDWELSWKMHLDTVRAVPTADPGLLYWLAICGEFYYCEAALLMCRSAGIGTKYPPEGRGIALRCINAFLALYRSRYGSGCVPVGHENSPADETDLDVERQYSQAIENYAIILSFLLTAIGVQPLDIDIDTDMADELWRLSATEAHDQIQKNILTVERYATSLLDRIQERDGTTKAWVHIDRELVLARARQLDHIPPAERGPLHGFAVGVKDVFLTSDMPTQYNSRLFESRVPIALDAGPIQTLRAAGGLFIGKTTTTEFAATTQAGSHQNLTRNPHDPTRTAGGSSSGSGAAVGDFHVPIALGTQTGGSTVRPGSYNGVYGFKPTWGAISREGLAQCSISLDTMGFLARSVPDLQTLLQVFQVDDAVDPSAAAALSTVPFSLHGARIAFCKTPIWPRAGPGTVAAYGGAMALLTRQGAVATEIDLPAPFPEAERWQETIMQREGGVSFLGHYRQDKTKLHEYLVQQVEAPKYSSRDLVEAYDGAATLKVLFDSIARQYDCVVTPSVPDEAPVGQDFTGSACFCNLWTLLGVPALNVPGFVGEHGLPVGLTLVAPRYHDHHLLKVAETIGPLFVEQGSGTS